MENFIFNLQNHANEESGQADIAPADFGSMSAAEQSEILGNMVRGKVPATEVEQVEEVVDEEEEVDEKPTVAKRKIKVNGEEIELTDEELIAHAQKGMSADKKFEEAAKLRKEAKEEREQLEADRQAKQTESSKSQLTLTKQQNKQFADMFQQTFGEEYNPYDEDHQDIKTQYRVQQMLANQDQQRNQNIINDAYAWADKNPAEIEKLDDAIYSLASEPTARKQMSALITAKDRFDNGKASLNDLQILESFRTTATVTKSLPKEVVEEKKRVQKAEKSGGDTPSKQPQGIDWERAKTDSDYQNQVLATLTRSKQ